jgi:hypothetical protein
MKIAFLVLVATVGGASLYGQWLDYPTPGIPRLKNGKPNLAAPTPRVSGGRPDLSGIWQLQPRPCTSNCGDYQPAAEFFDMGATLPGGLPYQAWAGDLVKQRTADFWRDDPVGFCKPAGALRLLTYPPYRKILQTPAVTVILSERDVTYRQIFTDGRPLPKDPEPTWNGYSVGRWQGDSFVVETIGFRDGTWIDRNGSPITGSAKMKEVYRRTNFGNLEIEVTIDDPKAYTKPWTVKLHQLLVPDTELLDYHCTDNEKDASHLVGR